jgi:hypothetical protein
MKDKDFKELIAKGYVGYVVCQKTDIGWVLWVYGDDADKAGNSEVNKHGNRMRTDTGEVRYWDSLDGIITYLTRLGVEFKQIKLE